MSPLKLRYTQSRRQWWTHRKRYRGHKGAEETPPERLDAKVVAHFLRVCDEIWGYGEKERLTSMENNTPPIGEPNATATPAALAAVTISRIFPKCTNKQSPQQQPEEYRVPWLCENRPKSPATRLPTQHATCTDGPSLPTDSPEAMTKG